MILLFGSTTDPVLANVAARLATKNCEILVLNPRFYAEHLDLYARWTIRLEAQGPMPVVSAPLDKTCAILLGDLNVKGEGEEHGVMMEHLGQPDDLWLRWAETHPDDEGNTYPSPSNPTIRLDYIMAYDKFPIGNQQLVPVEIQNMQVRRDADWWSDHYPIEIELTPNLRASTAAHEDGSVKLADDDEVCEATAT